MIVGTATLAADLHVVVHREDSPGAGVPIERMTPERADYCGRPGHMMGPFAAVSRGRWGVGYTGGWPSFDAALKAIRIEAILNNRDPRLSRCMRSAV